jgi:hypothetical protein
VLSRQVILVFNMLNPLASIIHKLLYLFEPLELIDDTNFKILKSHDLQLFGGYQLETLHTKKKTKQELIWNVLKRVVGTKVITSFIIFKRNCTSKMTH